MKTGDLVTVIKGKDKGKRGRILRAIPSEGRVVVEGVNIQKRHMKPGPRTLQAGIVEQPGPISAANVMLTCPKCHTPTRTGRRVLESGKKVRVCKRCGEIVDRV